MSIRPWLVRGVPRAAILTTGVAEIVKGDVFYGAFCIVALTITLIPAIYARSPDAGVPLEIELALLWLMVTDMTLGNWLGLYVRLPWYDKVLHLSSSILLGTIGFLVVYVLHLTGRTRFHPWLDGVAILIVTLGIGALWEIAEYAVDGLLGRTTQTAPGFSRIDDTMTDLILDGVGGIVGAVLGAQYIRRSKRSRKRVEALAEIIAHRERVSATHFAV
ncbi:MAG: hypothetical protein AB7P03_14330 [Kofleriaceae bacterium]